MRFVSNKCIRSIIMYLQSTELKAKIDLILYEIALTSTRCYNNYKPIIDPLIYLQ